MKRLLLICSMFLMTMMSFSETYACSGGFPFTVDRLPRTDVIVHATVVEVDDRGYNAILRVDRYFKGEGSEYVAVMRWEPGLEVSADIRSYVTGCLYDGGGALWIPGSEGYFALGRQSNGTFTDGNGGRFETHFYVDEGNIEFYRRTGEYEFETETQTVAQFEHLLLDVGGKTEPSKPTGRAAYPLMRFLEITTEAGTRYRLNPDRSLSQLDEKQDPLAISPDGSHLAYRAEGDMIRLSAAYAEQWDLPRVAGKRILFSPDSNFAALWDEKSLIIEMFDNYVFAGRQLMSLQTVAEADLKVADRERLSQVAWSGDSTTVVFSDDSGLWSWDVFEQAEPRQIMLAEELSTFSLLEASRSGRYVRYGNDEDWTLIDTETGERIENAIATPDERNLIYINAENPPATLFDLSLMDESYQHQSCTAPIMESCPIVIDREGYRQLFWYKHDQIGILSCGDKFCSINSYSWDVSIARVPYSIDAREQYGRSLSYSSLPLTSDLAYDEQNDQFVEVIGDYSLKVGLFPTPLEYSILFGTVIDFSEQLDSPIAQIEWGQPIFYRVPPVIVR